jgi:N-acetylmuramoyl-L-alanine amidase
MAKKKIYLSPSNQIKNVGVNGYNELVQMHLLAEKVAQYLDNPMFETRISHGDWTPQQVADDSNSWGADSHLGLHSDAWKPNSQGTTAFVCTTKASTYDFAKILYKNVSEISPGKDRGIQIRKDLCELNETNADAALLENFFHTNIEEVEHFYKSIDIYAKAIAKSYYTYYGVPFETVYIEPPKKQPIALGYKAKIQTKCNYSNPESWWRAIDKEPYAEDFYKKWANSYN